MRGGFLSAGIKHFEDGVKPKISSIKGRINKLFFLFF